MATIPVELVPPFLAVAELGSFSAAATRLRVEKSSVSRAVSRLEDSVGERLFLRTTRNVALTSTGEVVRDRLRDAYASLDEALKSILETTESPRGKITMTAPADFAGVILSEALPRFHRRFPQITVDVRLSAEFLDLVSNNIDVAIRIASKRLKDSTLKARKLAGAGVGFYASRSYAEARGIPRDIDDAKEHTWVVHRNTRELVLNGPEGEVRLPQEGRLVCDEMGFKRDAILSGLGIGLLPVFLAESAAREGRLVQILTQYSIAPIATWFVTHSGTKRSQVTDGLHAALLEVMSARPSAFEMA